MKYELGTHAQDIITGFKGVVIGYCKYLTGCDQYLIQPVDENQEHEKKKPDWFDENRLKKAEGKKVILDTGAGVNDNGPDLPAPIK